LFQGGLENDHPKAPCLLPQLSSFDLKLSALTSIPSDKKENDAFLAELVKHEGRGAKLIDLCQKHGQRLPMLLPTIKSLAIKVLSGVFAVLLKHTRRVKLAIMASQSDELPPTLLFACGRKL
jgi:hypothetical protein